MMKHDHLFEKIVTFENLVEAAKRAMRGKKKTYRVACFWFDLETEVLDILSELREQVYRPRPFRTFTVTDPKIRRICAADFRDRVVHHAICAVIEPLLDRTFISDTYACRQGKGAHAALRRAQHFIRRYPYYLKFDIRKYFDSIDHELLKQLLGKTLTDKRLFALLDCIIDQPVPWTGPGKGIPIGNLTSQLFANLYLSPLDHLLKDELGVKGYLRYMDDGVIFSTDKGELGDLIEFVRFVIEKDFHLQLKERATVIAPASEGLGFLGYRIFPDRIRLGGGSFRRLRRNVQRNDALLAEDLIDIRSYERSMASLVGITRHADARNLRRRLFSADIDDCHL